MLNRLITISYTGLDAPGGVPKFNRDLHGAFPDRECVHYCWADYPYSDRADVVMLPEWDKARILNLYLLKSRKVTREDTVVADGFWAWGLESLPHAISHSHGIWGHVTWKDVQRGNEPENPFHHYAQIAFRGTWTRLGKRLTAVSEFIASEMEAQWQFKVDRVINNGVDTDVFRPSSRDTGLNDLLIIHGVNDRGNTNKGWDHIESLKQSIPSAHVLSLDEAQTLLNDRHEEHWSKPEALAAADIVVHPSGFEGNSMFVAEALACGVPVVGYDVGYLWGVDREYGMTVMSRDWRSPDLTVQTVKALLDDFDHALKLSGPEGLSRRLALRDLDIKDFRGRWRVYVSDVESGEYDQDPGRRLP